MKSSKPDDPLSATLAAWELTPRRDPAFRASVWSRIRAARRPATWASFARAHLPAVTAALAVALLVGGWAGRKQAQTQLAAHRAEIATAYVQSLDARAMRMP